MRPPSLPTGAALFLDFDGVLVEIAPRPDAISVPETLPGLLRALCQRQGGAMALISGRHIGDLRRYLPDFPGALAGSHGAELAMDGRTVTVFGTGLDTAALHAEARGLARGHDAILIEEKPLGVVMHFRADPALEGVVTQAMQRLRDRFPGTRLQAAKMALELHPEGVGKGAALARLMEASPFAGRMPVYVGDDLTDESALAEAQARGGFGIRIGSGDSVARYRLADPAALAQWLTAALPPEGEGV